MNLTHRVSLLHLFALAACAAVLLGSCRSQPVVIPATLSAAESFQRAQDATDAGNYPLAIRYYTEFRTNNPDNKDRGIWALYEIAFNYHKMGNDVKAVEILNQILQEYQTGTDTLPPAPRILAQELKDHWSQKSP